MAVAVGDVVQLAPRKKTFLMRVKDDFYYNKSLYLIALPVVAYYFIFKYIPMYGAIIAFKNYIPTKGIIGSPWVGFQHFQDFFASYYFWRILKNTLVISVSALLFGFPMPFFLALFLNEIRHMEYKKTIQTITYMPHFISLVVICGIIRDFVSTDGLISTSLANFFHYESFNMLAVKQLFVPIYVLSNIWQGVGWGSIIYLATIAGIDPQLYDAASIDGAGRFRKVINVTIPSIAPTFIILLILRLGHFVNVGYEKIILLYNEAIYDTADVISSFTYRKGLQDFAFSYSTAVGLFNSVINLALLVIANKISRKVSETSLW